MKRRIFSTALLATTAWLSALPAKAQWAFKAGKDYVVLDRPVPTDAGPGKVELLEFFWYSCPHCNKFEPTFAQWVKDAPKDVVVRRVPVAFRDDFAPQQRLFYTLEAMGQLAAVHPKVFAAIHTQRQRLEKEAEQIAFLKGAGVDTSRYAELSKSFSVQTKMRQAKQLTDAYDIDGVPTIGVHGRFHTSGSLAGDNMRALAVAEVLIARVRKGA